MIIILNENNILAMFARFSSLLKCKHLKFVNQLSKLKAECKYLDCEVPVFALCDRKSSNKEKEVLTFKQRQLGVLVFSSTTGWWLIKMVDGTTTSLGWVPRDFWRIVPVSRTINALIAVSELIKLHQMMIKN